MPIFDSTQLNVGQETQYFFDDLLIETVENVRRTFHLPEKMGTEPVLRKDKPWEHVLDISCNSAVAIRDPKDNLFKVWYTDWERVRFKPGEMLTGGCYRVLYAYSEDGVHWTKPALGIETIDGHDTNVVLGGNGYSAYNLAVLLDPFETDESRRFKGLCTFYKIGTDCDGAVYLTSGDGIHWTQGPRPQFGRHGSLLDDVTLLSYDKWSRIYIANVRHYDMYAGQRNYKTPCIMGFTPPYYPEDWARQSKRRMWQCESADMVHWSQPYLAVCPEDGLDELDATFYGLCQIPMGDVRLGLLNVMNYVHNDMRVRLVLSRDGHTWKHLNCRQPWLEPRGPGFWDAYMNTATSPPIRVGDDLYAFHGGAKNHHDWHYSGEREGLDVPEARDFSQVEYCLGLAKLRFDGYCSLEAGPARDGIFVTRPLISKGNHLQINASCAAGGSIAVEVVDHNDDVIPGFSKEECDVFTGDSVAHTVTWKGRNYIPVGSTERAKSLEPERERFRKLRFYMRKAHLYSMALS
jgi:hypothetical protein